MSSRYAKTIPSQDTQPKTVCVEPRSPGLPAKIRLFVVDEHPLMRRGLTALIDAEADMQACGVAENTVAAMPAIAEQRPDVVVIRVGRAQRGAIELIKAIKAHDPCIRVIALSMREASQHASQALEAGAITHVLKQDLAACLLEAFRRMRGGKIREGEKPTGANGGAKSAVGRAGLLSETEQAIVGLIGSGLPARGIAARLHLSVKTVDEYRRRIRRTLNFTNGTELVKFCVRWAEQNGLVPQESRTPTARQAIVQGVTVKSSVLNGRATPDEMPKLVAV